MKLHETDLGFWEQEAKKNPYHAVCESAQTLNDIKRKNDCVLFHCNYDYKEKVILDLCCGVGRLANFIAQDVARYVGVDWSKVMVEKAQELHRDKDNVSFQVNNGTDLTLLTPETFDLAICELAFQHMNKDTTQKYINEVFRVLKPEGIFIAQIPRKDYYDAFEEYTGRGFTFSEAKELFQKYSSVEFIVGYKHNYAYYLFKAKR